MRDESDGKRLPYAVKVGGMLKNPGRLSREEALEVAVRFRRQVEEAQERLARWEAYLVQRWGGERHG